MLVFQERPEEVFAGQKYKCFAGQDAVSGWLTTGRRSARRGTRPSGGGEAVPSAECAALRREVSRGHLQGGAESWRGRVREVQLCSDRGVGAVLPVPTDGT